MNKKISFISGFLFYRSILFICLLWLLSACNNAAEPPQITPSADESAQWLEVSMPDISQQPVRLRVAHVVNARFKQLNDQQIKKILSRTQQLVKQNFAIEVRFLAVETRPIEEIFKHLNANVIKQRRDEIVNLDFIDHAVRKKMQQSIYQTLENYSDNKQNVINFAQPYLINPDLQQKDFTGLSYALVDTLISRLSYWKKQKAGDGQPVLTADKYHEWVWWDSLGYSDLAYDVMITNQLVASAEYHAMDVHSSIRGGLTAGTTTYNKNTASNAYVYIMTYPILNDTDLLTMLRNEKSYSEQQIVNYTAALLTHELGHMLLHLGHPFGNKHCIMSPTIMLDYRQWYNALDAGQCPLGSSEAMTPGVAKITYNRNW